MRNHQKRVLQNLLASKVLAKIVLIQRWVRAKLLRCRFLHMRRSAILIQVRLVVCAFIDASQLVYFMRQITFSRCLWLTFVYLFYSLFFFFTVCISLSLPLSLSFSLSPPPSIVPSPYLSLLLFFTLYVFDSQFSGGIWAVKGQIRCFISCGLL